MCPICVGPSFLHIRSVSACLYSCSNTFESSHITDGPPGGFNFHESSNDPFIEDNKELTTYNVEDRLKQFYTQASWLANHTRGKHIMWTMGSDFNYENGQSWFENMDALIRIVNADNKGFKCVFLLSKMGRFAFEFSIREKGNHIYLVTLAHL